MQCHINQNLVAQVIYFLGRPNSGRDHLIHLMCFLSVSDTSLSSNDIHPKDQELQRHCPRQCNCTLPIQPQRTANNRFSEVHLELCRLGGMI